MEAFGLFVELVGTELDGDAYFDFESKTIHQVEANVEKVVICIPILAAIPTVLLSKDNFPLPTEFFALLFVAAVAILGGSLSWLGAMRSSAPQAIIAAIRQLKVESYVHGLTWTLAAIVSLYDWISVNISIN
jgi:hypothetical protein